MTVLVASDVVVVTVIACVVVDVRRQIAAAHLVVREDVVHYELKRCAQILERTQDYIYDIIIKVFDWISISSYSFNC